MLQLEDADVSLDFEIFYNGQYSLKKTVHRGVRPRPTLRGAHDGHCHGR